MIYCWYGDMFYVCSFNVLVLVIYDTQIALKGFELEELVGIFFVCFFQIDKVYRNSLAKDLHYVHYFLCCPKCCSSSKTYLLCVGATNLI